jgi:hypothetical protein
MLREGSHISDERLLLGLEGELAPQEQAAVSSHLRACWECRARRREIESAITDFIRIHHREFDCKLPPVAGRRALLRAQLAQLAESESSAGWLRIVGSMKRRVPAIALGLAILFSSAYLVRSSLDFRPAPEVSFPDARLTPGAATLADMQAVCSQSNVKNKVVSAALQKKVFTEYGILRPEPRAYEVDYLVTPALGGADDLRNLWPHSYSAVWNARVKDDLEDLLRNKVCDGTLELGQAQREIAQNWIAAYKKYFHTDRPLAER